MIEFGEGETVECPHCGKEFNIESIDDEEWDDSDVYFEHVSMCDGEDG